MEFFTNKPQSKEQLMPLQHLWNTVWRKRLRLEHMQTVNQTSRRIGFNFAWSGSGLWSLFKYSVLKWKNQKHIAVNVLLKGFLMIPLSYRSNLAGTFKDIVQPKKRRWDRDGYQSIRATSYKIADVFSRYTLKDYYRALISKKTVTGFRAKTGGFFFMSSALPKTQRLIETLRYSPCDDTPTAVTVVLTTGRIALLICKHILFCFCTPPTTTPVVTATVSAVISIVTFPVSQSSTHLLTPLFVAGQYCTFNTCWFIVQCIML